GDGEGGPLGLDGGAVRDGGHAHDGGALFGHGGGWDAQPDARLKMDVNGVGGIADVLDGLQVRNPVEEDVALHHAAVRDRPEGRVERQRLLGEVDLEDVVVWTGGRVGQWRRADGKVLWPEDRVQAGAPERPDETRDAAQIRLGSRDSRGQCGHPQFSRGRYLAPSEPSRLLEGLLGWHSVG